MFGKKPEGATYYARQGRFEFIAWGAPPPPGDNLCLGLTGRTENQLVRDILDGKFDSLLERCGGEGQPRNG